MGVWIETVSPNDNRRHRAVTPCMGVWIETYLPEQHRAPKQRHTLYGCVD